ncbi:Chaperone protein ClpB 1 [bioreactor metagenome]|uniref:Chaperone protein ClpB 1 n=1 Tax=bioreactor metagenome TaxID=1076179 RepID=A0A645E508_9ZZZZ
MFKALKRDELYSIMDLMLKEVINEVSEKRITLDISKEAKDYILEVGYDEKYGARPLRRAIQKYIEDEIAEQYLQKKFADGSHIKVELKEGKISLE